MSLYNFILSNFAYTFKYYHDYRQFNKDEAVSAFEIRLEPYLCQQELVTLDGKLLDQKLIDFDEKCENNKQTYFETHPTNQRSAKGYSLLLKTGLNSSISEINRHLKFNSVY